MRWSQLAFPFLVGFSALSLTACLNGKDNKSSVNVASPTAGPSQKTLTPQEQQRRSQMNADQLCYEDLCQPGTKEVSFALLAQKAQTPSEQQKKYFEQYVRPLLAKATESEINSVQVFLNALNVQESQFAGLHFSPDQLRLMKAILIVSNSKLISPATSDIIAVQLRSTSYSQAYSLSVVKGAKSYFESLYPRMPLPDAVRAEINKILSIQDKLNNSLGAKLFYMEKGSLARVINGGVPDTDDLNRVRNNSRAMRIIETLLDETSSLTEKVSVSEEQMKDIYFRGDLRAKVNSYIVNLQKNISFCEPTFYQALNLYPQQKEIEAFKVTAEKVRQQVLDLLDSNDPAYAAVKKAQLYLPENSESISTSWLKSLQTGIDGSNTATENMKTQNAPTILLRAIFLSMNPKQDSNFCKDLVDFDVSDKTNPIDTGIKVSWFSVKRPDYGASIVAHELGHIVSAHSRSFDTQKACLTDKQGGSNQFQEEDIADLIALKVVTKSQNTLQHNNFGCALASMEKEPHLLNIDKKDVHSSPLYRALQVASARKEAIPASCMSLVNAQAPQALRSCD